MLVHIVTMCERSGFMDIVLLSRWQFAITTIYHFLFVPVTLGLTLFLALLETCYVTTKRAHWKEPCRKLLKFFGAIFLVNFAMGVVTGIVQEFHFGMNWSEYSRFMGDIFGAPLALKPSRLSFWSPPSSASGYLAGTSSRKSCTAPASGWWPLAVIYQPSGF